MIPTHREQVSFKLKSKFSTRIRVERGFTVFINGIEHFFVSVIKVLTQLFNVIVIAHALRQAAAIDPRAAGTLPSTKGML